MWLLLIMALLLSGCSYIDWAGPWFGCSKGQVLKPATYGMFGTVKRSAECVDEPQQSERHLPNGVTEQDIQMKSDYQYCLDNGLHESVDVCMERKGWRHP